MILAHARQDYTTYKDSSSSGILYQNLGKAKILSQEYTLLHYYNLSIVDQKLTLINRYYYDSLSTCNLAISEHYTMVCRNQLRYILGNIKQFFRIVVDTCRPLWVPLVVALTKFHSRYTYYRHQPRWLLPSPQRKFNFVAS